jgi:hypothetical protein
MNILLLSSPNLHRAASADLQECLWREGIEVWLDWPIERESYADQMLSMMNRSTLVVFLVNTEFFASPAHAAEWEAARLSRTPKLVLQLDNRQCPAVNETFTVCPDCNLQAVPELVLRYVHEQLRLAIFVSYARRDASKVDILLDLVSRSLANVWIDRSGLRPGEQFPDAILNAITSCESIPSPKMVR